MIEIIIEIIIAVGFVEMLIGGELGVLDCFFKNKVLDDIKEKVKGFHDKLNTLGNILLFIIIILLIPSIISYYIFNFLTKNIVPVLKMLFYKK